MRKTSDRKPIRRSAFVLTICVLALAGCDPFQPRTDGDYVAEARKPHDRPELKAAVSELKNALQKNPDNGDARALLGRVETELGDGVGAAKQLRRAGPGPAFGRGPPTAGEAL
jgi:cytochrome c-type biogenesis protein CcmH/NrfG